MRFTSMVSLIQTWIDMPTKTYRYTVEDVEHPGDYERFATAIREGGGEIIEIIWSGESGDEAVIRFSANFKDIFCIQKLIQNLL